VVTAFVHIPYGAREVMIDPHMGRTAKIICNGKNFVSRFTLAE